MALGTISIVYYQNIKLQKKLSISEANVKACLQETNLSGNKITALQLTVEQLEYFNDSIIQKLDSCRKALKVRDSQLKSAQYIKSVITRTDTIIYNDTIFKDNFVDIDTVLQDKWYSAHIGLRYPNIVSISPQFISEKFIIVSYNKETIKPPSRWWIVRLFQKKHKVIKVEVVDNNPYIKNKNQQFIEIIK